MGWDGEGWDISKMAVTGTGGRGADEDGNAAGTPERAELGLLFRASLCSCSPPNRVASGHLPAQGTQWGLSKPAGTLHS